MADFKNNPPKDMDERFLWWAKVKELLPGETTLDDYLKSINIAKAESFSLDFNEEKGLTIMPRLLIRKDADTTLGTLDLSDNKPEAEDLLPIEIQRQFGEFFLRRSSAQCRYGLGGGWYVVIPASLQKALNVVHSIKDEPVEVKRDFINNPRAVLKEKLEEELEEDIFESIFVETPIFLSERIKYFGEWHPKAGLFIKTQGGKWLPEGEYTSEVGFYIGDKVYQVKSVDIKTIEKKLLEAKEQNIDYVEYNGQSFPVNDEAINAVKIAAEHIQSGLDAKVVSSKDDTYSDIEDKTSPQKPYKPIIYDNIEDDNIEDIEKSLDSTQKKPIKKRSIFPITPETNPQISLQAHQLDGVQWLQRHWEYCSKGALLADDMGLGKTLQTLVFLRWVKILMQKDLVKPRPFLIIAPTGLLKVWEEEERKHLAPPGLGESHKSTSLGIEQ